MTRIFLISALSLGLLSVSRADADPIVVTGYDITDALVSGSGGWAHTYTGTITPTTVPGVNFQVANYTGGGGTLNDGIIGKTILNSQLFDVAARSTITLHFADVQRVTEISLFGGDIPQNSVPGSLRGTVTVTANGVTADVPAQPFGRFSVIGIPVNDHLALAGTPLEGILASSISLSGFHSEFLDDRPIGNYSITEITVNVPQSPVPEPTTLSLIVTAIVGVAVRRTRRPLRWTALLRHGRCGSVG
jgi:hypothetical protein